MKPIKFKYIFTDGKEFKSTILSLPAIENGQLKAFTNNIPSSFKLVAVCQFTGAITNNGDEIYDGSILRLTDDYDQSKSIHPVSFIESAFRCERLDDEEFKYFYLEGNPFLLENYEVIGNIYENKELLEE